MSARLLKPVIALPDDYEMVTLPDGKQILRERQTKAQARIQALKAKGRNEKLRQSLIVLSRELNEGEGFTAPKKIAHKDQTAINHQIKEHKNIFHLNGNPASVYSNESDSVVDSCPPLTVVNESSAIQRQIIVNTEKKAGRLEYLDANKKHQPQKAEFKGLNLKRFIFG